MHEVFIYTDGACSGNPGAGGWGSILICRDRQRKISGGETSTTNNRMELTAVVKALQCLKTACKVFIFSDSAYVVNAFTQGWIISWQKKGWKTNGNKLVQNRDLWEKLLQAMQPHIVTFQKVKGHADDALNNECDKLAKAAVGNFTR